MSCISSRGASCLMRSTRSDPDAARSTRAVSPDGSSSRLRPSSQHLHVGHHDAMDPREPRVLLKLRACEQALAPALL